VLSVAPRSTPQYDDKEPEEEADENDGLETDELDHEPPFDDAEDDADDEGDEEGDEDLEDDAADDDDQEAANDDDVDELDDADSQSPRYRRGRESA
jgi:hypothetical protein